MIGRKHMQRCHELVQLAERKAWKPADFRHALVDVAEQLQYENEIQGSVELEPANDKNMCHLIKEYEMFIQQIDEQILRASPADLEALIRVKSAMEFALSQFRAVVA